VRGNDGGAGACGEPNEATLPGRFAHAAPAQSRDLAGREDQDRATRRERVVDRAHAVGSHGAAEDADG
jgi:hypothetical protein